MFPYADYEFYIKKSHGKLAQDAFEINVLEASFFLQYITLGKSDKQQPEALRYAVCAITDMYVKERERAEEGVLKAENNDGYSVTYVTEMKDGETIEELLQRKAMNIARKYLIHTGLLNWKVGATNAD